MAGGFHSTRPSKWRVALVARVTSKLPSALKHLILFSSVFATSISCLDSNWNEKFSAISEFLQKDSTTFLITICFFFPWILGDPENFIPANPLVTPVHIQPEWYFLFAYAILRSIPRKLGGVAALAASVLILYIFPIFKNKKFNSLQFYPVRKFLFWSFISLFFLLS